MHRNLISNDSHFYFSLCLIFIYIEFHCEKRLKKLLSFNNFKLNYPSFSPTHPFLSKNYIIFSFIYIESHHLLLPPLNEFSLSISYFSYKTMLIFSFTSYLNEFSLYKSISYLAYIFLFHVKKHIFQFRKEDLGI